MSALLLVVLVIFGSAAFREMRTASIERATNRLERITHQLAVASGASSAPRIRTMRNLAADTLLVQAVTGRGSPGVTEKLVAFLEETTHVESMSPEAASSHSLPRHSTRWLPALARRTQTSLIGTPTSTGQTRPR